MNGSESRLVQIYDPAMCCSTGVCGPSIDPALARVAADLAWLTREGVRVERFNLSQEASAFAINSIVRRALHEQGPECLPMVLVDGVVFSQGKYPSRAMLARHLNLDLPAAPVGLTVL